MNYLSLLNKLELYKSKYKVKNIGETHFKRKIMAVEIINNESYPTAILLAGIHAREHITTDLLCKMIDEKLFDKIKDFNISIILMANPDGVELCTGGIMSAPIEKRESLLKINMGSVDFSMWKANGRGVDLNNNFNAGFDKNIKKTTFASSGYRGEIFESESETEAIASYTRQIKPFLTISYHSKGEEIYYNYFQYKRELERDTLIAERFAKSTGYKIENPEMTSSGGYKDYCVLSLKIPSLTIEVGSDNLHHPISELYLDEIYDKNKFIARDLVFAYEICKKYGINN